MSPLENCILEAFEAVCAWDLPDEEFAEAINAQARLLCGVSSDDYWQPDLDTTIQ